MKKFTYNLTTLSSLIVSPRASKAFYEGFSLQGIMGETTYLEKSKLKVIYPFYQYGEYDKYEPESADYYLPGTSIKGVLRQGTFIPCVFMVDDVPVHNNAIVLRNLYKVQYLKDEQKAKFEVYFENVGVEMIKGNMELRGEIYVKDRESAKELLESSNRLTRAKLSQVLKYLSELQKRKYCEELLCVLHTVANKIRPLLNASNIYLLGGYKGLIHSIEPKESQQELAGAIYLDHETMLPHGLAKIDLE